MFLSLIVFEILSIFDSFQDTRHVGDDSFRDISGHIYDYLKFVGGLWSMQTFFWVNR